MCVGYVSGYGLGENSCRVGYEHASNVGYANLIPDPPKPWPVHNFILYLPIPMRITYLTVNSIFQDHDALKYKKGLGANRRN